MVTSIVFGWVEGLKMVKYQEFNKYLQRGLTALLVGLQLFAGHSIAEAAQYAQPEKRKILFVETEIGPSKKREFMDQLVGRKPDYVDTIEIVNEEPEQQNVNFTKTLYAATVPVDSTKVGKGTKSRILVFKTAFGENDYPPSLGGNMFAEESVIYSADRSRFLIPLDSIKASDLELIVRNDILHGQFSAAKYFRDGIDEYPIAMFHDSTGIFNSELFKNFVLARSSYEKYKALKPLVKSDSNRDLKFQLKLFKVVIALFYDSLSYPEFIGKMNPSFIQKLKDDFDRFLEQ